MENRVFETFVRANKKLGTISYEAPEALMVEFSQKCLIFFK